MQNYVEEEPQGHRTGRGDSEGQKNTIQHESYS